MAKPPWRKLRRLIMSIVFRHLTIRHQPPAAVFGGGSAGCRVRRTPRNGDIHCALQAKFVASFVLPTPVYCATCG